MEDLIDLLTNLKTGSGVEFRRDLFDDRYNQFRIRCRDDNWRTEMVIAYECIADKTKAEQFIMNVIASGFKRISISKEAEEVKARARDERMYLSQQV